MNINERITALRREMKEKNIDVYIIPSADNHQSEYVGDYFKCRAFITGFTGSAGTAVISHDKAGLWTDGRYFIQAENELAGSEITLYKMGNPGVPTVDEYLETVLDEHATLGFDGRVISMSDGKKYEELFAHKNISIECRYDLIDAIWADRPAMSKEPIFLLDETYTGESTSSKLARLREEMKKVGATSHIIITLDDIAWLFNFRGRDVACTPVALCYAFITLDSAHLFIDELKVSDEIKTIFAKDNVQLHPYNDVYSFIQALESSEVLMLDPERLNYALNNLIPSSVKRIEQINPCLLFKAMKNEIEIENIRIAHIKDAVAHTKFMYWVKNNYNKLALNELNASEKLESLRAEQDSFMWPSFEPISAYGSNAAMCHYSSSEETNAELKEGTLYLTDTGGNYKEGSTDITRTVALGSISDEMKFHFTNVLRGNLALANAKFLYGCSGMNLDILARQYLWSSYLDYNHGTGHGVGYLLSIHEPGGRINWKKSEEGMRALEEGMVITDEPGIYIENSHGIRLENELLVRKDLNTEYGQFMKFEVLTFVPFDLDAIDSSLLRDDEKELLNNYHKQVYDIVSPHLNEEEKEWLKTYTRSI